MIDLARSPGPRLPQPVAAEKKRPTRESVALQLAGSKSSLCTEPNSAPFSMSCPRQNSAKAFALDAVIGADNNLLREEILSSWQVVFEAVSG